MKASTMRTRRWVVAGAAALLAACASQTGVMPTPQVVQTNDGAREISSTSARLICDQARCPVLTARWSSQRPAVVVLNIGLPYQQAEVTGADFHFGASQVVRLRVKSAQAPVAADYPVTAFDVPVSLIDSLAYNASGWVRVTMAGGGAVEETVSTGDAQSDAVAAMRQFLRAVDGATGTQPDARANSNGLFDLLK